MNNRTGCGMPMTRNSSGSRMPSTRNRRSSKGAVAYHAGLAAEDSVADRYARCGRPIRDKRWRGQAGEIDLVAEDGEGLIFVEVKKSTCFAAAAESLSQRQMHRISDAAAEYLGQMPNGQLTDVRFDVALVNGTGDVQIIENAFGH